MKIIVALLLFSVFSVCRSAAVDVAPVLDYVEQSLIAVVAVCLSVLFLAVVLWANMMIRRALGI
ncbi:MAG: hypothetical protein AB7I35_14010 [Ramlibacter sp.]